MDRVVLLRVKIDAILINTAREPSVGEAAMVKALENGVIAAAGLDVFENKPSLAPGLAALLNSVPPPHDGSAIVSV